MVPLGMSAHHTYHSRAEAEEVIPTAVATSHEDTAPANWMLNTLV